MSMTQAMLMQGGVPLAGNTLYLLHLDTDFADDVVGNSWAQTASPLISSTQAKFGAGAMSTPDAATRGTIRETTNVGGTFPTTNLFCADAFLYWTSAPSGGGLLYRIKLAYVTFSDAKEVVLSAAGWTISCNFDGLSVSNGFDTPTTGVWHHVRATYDNITLRLFIDGVLIDSDVGSGKTITGPATQAEIDMYTDFGYGGGLAYIDECRFVINDSVSTSDFTPPASPFTV